MEIQLNISRFHRLAKEFPNLTAIRVAILLEINEYPGITASEISENLENDQKTIQFHLKTMGDGRKAHPKAALNMIKATKNKEDNRRFNLNLTPTGQRIIDVIKGFE